jgi:cytoskeletal protein RodZ
MKSPGNILRKEREKQKKSLSEIARSLHINMEYMKSIEEDNYDDLPAEVFTKAYLRLYAEKLRLDSDEILSLYKNQYETGIGESPIEKEITPDRNIMSGKPALLIILIAAALIAGIMFMSRDKDDSPVKPEAESEKSEPVAEKKPELLSLKVTASELTWVSVALDDGNPREWLLHTGDEIELMATQVFKVKIGNAGGTRLLLNGEDLGSLGPPGKIVDLTLTENYTLPVKE